MPEPARLVCPHCGAVNRLPPQRPAGAAKCGACHALLFEGHPAEVDEAGFERHVRAGDLPVLVDIWAPWCGPCRAMAPMFARAAGELEPEVRPLKLNADTAPHATQQLGVRGIPALYLLRAERGRDGHRRDRALDARPPRAERRLKETGTCRSIAPYCSSPGRWCC